MSYESSGKPIKIGYLMDSVISEHFPQHFRDDLTNPFEMVFGEALKRGASTGRSRSCTAKSKVCRRARSRR